MKRTKSTRTKSTRTIRRSEQWPELCSAIVAIATTEGLNILL